MEKSKIQDFHKKQFSEYVDSDKKRAKEEKNRLRQLIPQSLFAKFSDFPHSHQILYHCILNLHSYSRHEELGPFFQQIGADIKIWLSKLSNHQKSEYLLACLQKNIHQGLKKINNQPNIYSSNCSQNDKFVKGNDKQKSSDFDWLVVNTKNQMLKSKLKTKLVQTINEYKNEKKLRQVMGKQLEEDEKIHLEDQSIDLEQDEKDKIAYKWSDEDQQLFLDNIKKLKDKFTHTEFLKNCHRYKFITESELKTLACQQISRKLDKENKAFLSRQFLLDKYFSANENLTEKQMKFILKTSPLLSKCVDKTFVKAAIKNIKYEDIDKMELKIAEEIISRFEMIRNLVKSSRRQFKQVQNNWAKKKIVRFEKNKEFKQNRQVMIEKLNHHKTKMMRNINYRPQSALQKSKNKENGQKQFDFTKKVTWPVPLNNHHPPTSLFIRDCSQQLNDELNQYQKNYLQNFNKNSSVSKASFQKSDIVHFYTGGPIDIYNVKAARPQTGNRARAENKKDRLNPHGNIHSTLDTVCEAFKIGEYKKQMQEKLNSYQIESEQESCSDKKTFTNSINKSTIDVAISESTKKKGKNSEDEKLSISKKPGNLLTEKVIKQKITEAKEKTKIQVYIKKLHSLASENAFQALKALNVKFTPSQINSLDRKGNTALYYATKHRNLDFIDYLLASRADVNIKCSKGKTPLHNAFASSNYSIICKCLAGPFSPNLNALDDENKTPLAYCCRKILQMLGLQEGVVSVDNRQQLNFNNNLFLCVKDNSLQSQPLQGKLDIRSRSQQVRRNQ